MSSRPSTYARKNAFTFPDVKIKRDIDAILSRNGSITRAMSKRIQEDWARDAEEGPRVLMNLRVDF